MVWADSCGDSGVFATVTSFQHEASSRRFPHPRFVFFGGRLQPIRYMAHVKRELLIIILEAE